MMMLLLLSMLSVEISLWKSVGHVNRSASVSKCGRGLVVSHVDWGENRLIYDGRFVVDLRSLTG